MYLQEGLTGWGWAGIGKDDTPAPSAEPLSQLDVMSPKIDVFAQRALFRLLKREPPANLAARQMIYAVKTGRLAGIYKEDERAPAMRAQALGMGWWQLISRLAPGKDAACVTQPAGSLPMIVFRDKARSIPDRLDPALLDAWAQCGIGDIVRPPYEPKEFPQAPPPKKKPPVHISPSEIPWITDIPRGDRTIPEEPTQCGPVEIQRLIHECTKMAALCGPKCFAKSYAGLLLPPEALACIKLGPGAIPAALACLATKAPQIYFRVASEYYKCLKDCLQRQKACMESARRCQPYGG